MNSLSRWEVGRTTIDAMLASGDLDRVKPDRELARSVIRQADDHLVAARMIVDLDALGCLNLAYEAARKAFAAVLENQGLRPTVRGGHRAVEESIRAQLVPPLKSLVDAFGWMRSTRHASTYVSNERSAATREDAAHAIDYSEAIIEKSRAAVESMPPF